MQFNRRHVELIVKACREWNAVDWQFRNPTHMSHVSECACSLSVSESSEYGNLNSVESKACGPDQKDGN
jgi:hypothetical protein